MNMLCLSMSPEINDLNTYFLKIGIDSESFVGL